MIPIPIMRRKKKKMMSTGIEGMNDSTRMLKKK
jgi:hypothetical protein